MSALDRLLPTIDRMERRIVRLEALAETLDKRNHDIDASLSAEIKDRRLLAVAVSDRFQMLAVALSERIDMIKDTLSWWSDTLWWAWRAWEREWEEGERMEDGGNSPILERVGPTFRLP